MSLVEPAEPRKSQSWHERPKRALEAAGTNERPVVRSWLPGTIDTLAGSVSSGAGGALSRNSEGRAVVVRSPVTTMWSGSSPATRSPTAARRSSWNRLAQTHEQFHHPQDASAQQMTQVPGITPDVNIRKVNDLHGGFPGEESRTKRPARLEQEPGAPASLAGSIPHPVHRDNHAQCPGHHLNFERRLANQLAVTLHRQGPIVWMATARRAVRSWMLWSSRCRPRTTLQPTLSKFSRVWARKMQTSIWPSSTRTSGPQRSPEVPRLPLLASTT